MASPFKVQDKSLKPSEISQKIAKIGFLGLSKPNQRGDVHSMAD